MKIANAKNFKSLTEVGVVLVDFWAKWCGPCRMLGPVIEELSEELAGKVEVCKCNVDDCPEIAGNFNIRSVPTLILFNNGKVVDTSTGVLSKAVIKKWIEAKIS
ncbi:MAG: thioredoxin [Rickettsiales bacterium]|jgi:thioredoxin 1|nr:thioredoxin [Rickettsiales bacterium]